MNPAALKAAAPGKRNKAPYDFNTAETVLSYGGVLRLPAARDPSGRGTAYSTAAMTLH
ncbi:hypothetical protein GCM10027298_30610 [Epidermidibacterium keratini]